MNKYFKKSANIVLYPFSVVIGMIQIKMDFFRTYRLKLIIASVLRILRIINGSAGLVQFPDTLYPSAENGGNKKIVFIDHSYHYKTASPSFFIDLLRQAGSVRVIWDSQWNGGKFTSPVHSKETDCDILVLWQIMIYHHPAKLKKLKCKNVILVPMYDDIHADPDSLFLRYREFRFISFSRDLQARFDRLGLQSRYFQYYTDPETIPVQTDFSVLKGFFWQRTNDITWDHIRILIGGTGFTSFHLHLALDPIWYREVLPTVEEMNKYQITITRWFERKEDYLSVLSKANVFFTPRLFEGIGMPVLEAMSMTKLVVSPDHPTMNEYISHRNNGLLYNASDLKPLDFSGAAAMATRARQDSVSGFDRWKHTRD